MVSKKTRRRLFLAGSIGAPYLIGGLLGIAYYNQTKKLDTNPDYEIYKRYSSVKYELFLTNDELKSSYSLEYFGYPSISQRANQLIERKKSLEEELKQIKKSPEYTDNHWNKFWDETLTTASGLGTGLFLGIGSIFSILYVTIRPILKCKQLEEAQASRQD
jgi:hypothetical protein